MKGRIFISCLILALIPNPVRAEEGIAKLCGAALRLEAKTVNLKGRPCSPDALQHIDRFEKLEQLWVSPENVTAAIVPALARQRKLRYLNFDAGRCEHRCVWAQGCAHHDDCWSNASQVCQQLCRWQPDEIFLNLEGTTLWSQGLTALAGLSRDLRIFTESPPDDDALAALASLPSLSSFNCPSANCLDLTGAGGRAGSGLTRQGLEHLRKLVELEVVHLPPELITDETVETLASLPKLRAVNWDFQPSGTFILGSKVTAKGLAELAAHPGVERLFIPRKLVTDETLELLRTFPHLKGVNCSATTRWVSAASSPGWSEGLIPCARLDSENVTAAGVKALDGLTRTEAVVIEPALIDDDLLRTLAAMSHLDSINCIFDDDPYRQPCAISSCVNLAGTSVTAEGLRSLRRRRPRSLLLPEAIEPARAKRLLPGVSIHVDPTPLLQRSCGR